MEKSYKEILPNIKTFIFDVDGVLTDGLVTITSNGELIRTMHTKDGYALKTAVLAGFNVCIISGGTNEGVRMRLKGLGITDIYLGVHDKLESLYEYIDMYSLKSDQILFMGDDLPDYPVMKKVGLPCCPKDAVQEISKFAEVRNLDKLGARFCVVDGKELVFMVLDDKEVHPTYDVGIWVNTPFFASAIDGLFNEVWDKLKAAK